MMDKPHMNKRGMRYKLAGRGLESRKDEIFNLPNRSGRALVLGSTQPLTEMSTRKLPGGKGRPARKVTTLLPSVSRLSRENVGASTSDNPMGLHSLLQGQLLYK
jgi:hypothetical protein